MNRNPSNFNVTGLRNNIDRPSMIVGAIPPVFLLDMIHSGKKTPWAKVKKNDFMFIPFHGNPAMGTAIHPLFKWIDDHSTAPRTS